MTIVEDRKTSPVHRLAELTVKMAILLKAKCLNVILQGHRKINPKIHYEAQKTPNNQINPKQKRATEKVL
jgi:hypothetical protein